MGGLGVGMREIHVDVAFDATQLSAAKHLVSLDFGIAWDEACRQKLRQRVSVAEVDYRIGFNSGCVTLTSTKNIEAFQIGVYDIHFGSIYLIFGHQNRLISGIAASTVDALSNLTNVNGV